MYLPKNNSSKGENGKLLVIGGSRDYSGAPILSLKTAIRFCDIVLFYPAEFDKYLISSVKTIPEVIVSYDLDRAIRSADSILFGVGASNSLFNMNKLKNSNKKVIIDGDGIKLVSKLSKNFLLTPNKKEFLHLCNKFGTYDIKRLSKYLGCTILKKGYENQLCYMDSLEIIKGGNPGLTKAGTGDVLSGLISALSTKNSLWDSAFFSLKAILNSSNSLFRRKGYFYSASDVVEQLPYEISKLFDL